MSEESLDMRTTVALVKVRVELLSDCRHEGRKFIRRAVHEISEDSVPEGGLPVLPQLLGGSPLPIRRLNNVQVRSLQEKEGRSDDTIGVSLEAPRLFVAHGRAGHVLGGFIAGEEDRVWSPFPPFPALERSTERPKSTRVTSVPFFPDTTQLSGWIIEREDT